MSWIGVILWLLPKRLRSSWVLLAMAFLGVTTAVTLLAVGAIYSRALAEGGLRHALAIASPSILNIRVTVQNRPLGPADYQNLRTTIEGVSQDRISFMLQDVQRHGRAQPNLPLLLRPDSETGLGGLVGRPFFLTDFERHSRLVQGRWPEAAPVLRQSGPSAALRTDLEMEGVLGERAARTMGIEVGSPVFLLPFPDDPAERIVINIVGTVEPADPDAEYWMGSPVYFSLQDYNDTPLVPIYVPEDAFFGGLGAKYPALVGDYEWFLFLDTGALTVDNVESTRNAMAGLETDINKRFPRSTVLTFLENSNNTGLLSTYQRDLTLARIPILLFLSLVVVVILYFLALVLNLLARSRSDEASLLRSRGANMPQVSGLFLVGEVIIIVLASVLGPFLAWVAAQNLLVPSINPAGEGAPVSAGLSVNVFLWGAVGGLLSLGVLVASSVSLSRLGILEFLRARARPLTTPLLQRYYVDLLVLALLGVLLWQVQGRQGFVDRALTGRDLQVDPTLLLGPALVLLAAAFLLLRALPFVAQVLAWSSRRITPSWVTFTLVRVARDPLPYGSLTVIVMLAAALGVFGAAFQTTLSRSQQEQALYNVGGDLVLTGVSFPLASQEERFREIRSVLGVRAISPVFRESVRTLDGPSSFSASLLGVEPVTLPDAAWYRDDFSPDGKSLSQLLVPLRRGPSGLPDLSGYTAAGIPIPEDAHNIGLWVNADQLDTGPLSPPVNLHLRLLGSGGNYRTLTLGDIRAPAATEQGWRYLEAPLPDNQVFLERPFNVVAIFVTTDAFSRTPPGSLSFDDLTVTRGLEAPSGPGEVIAGFEEPGRWVAFPHDKEEPDTVQTTLQVARSGQGGLSYSWTEALSSSPRGVLIPAGQFPLPAIGGPGFQIGQVVRISAGRQLVPVVINDITSFFPTVDTTFGPLLIVPVEGYTQYLRRVGGSVDRPGEFWIALDDAVDREQAIAALRDTLPPFARIADRDAVVELNSRDPLSGGSWNGLTTLGIAALTLAVVLALGTHAVVAVRSSKTDLTVIRALGFSRIQTLLSLALERFVAVALGLAVGSVLGHLLARWVLGFLDTTAGGREVIPPMVFTTQAWIVGLTVVCLLAAAFLSIALAGISASRLRASDILRNTE